MGVLLGRDIDHEISAALSQPTLVGYYQDIIDELTVVQQ